MQRYALDPTLGSKSVNFWQSYQISLINIKISQPPFALPFNKPLLHRKEKIPKRPWPTGGSNLKTLKSQKISGFEEKRIFFNKNIFHKNQLFLPHFQRKFGNFCCWIIFLIQTPSRTKPRKKYDFQSGQLRATPFNSWELLGGIDFEDGMVINTWLKNIAKNITGSLSVSKTRPVSRILVAPKRQKTITRQVTVKKNNWWNSVCVSGVSDSDEPTPPAINFNEFHKIYAWAPKPKIGKISFKLDFAKLIGHQDLKKNNKIFQKPKKKHHISLQKFALQQFRRGYCEILFFVLGTGPVNRWLLEAPGNHKVHKVGRRAGWLLLKNHLDRQNIYPWVFHSWQNKCHSCYTCVPAQDTEWPGTNVGNKFFSWNLQLALPLPVSEELKPHLSGGAPSAHHQLKKIQAKNNLWHDRVFQHLLGDKNNVWSSKTYAAPNLSLTKKKHGFPFFKCAWQGHASCWSHSHQHDTWYDS